jgi:hypothetical protein
MKRPGGTLQVRVPLFGTIRVMGRNTSCLEFYPELRGRLHRNPNSASTFSMHGPTTGKRRDLNLGKLSSGHFVHELTEDPEGVLLSRRVVTVAGVNYLTSTWLDGASPVANLNAHGNGTGSAAEATANTGLVAEVGTRVAGVKSRPTPPAGSSLLLSVGTVLQGATQAIVEHGLFDTVTPPGVLWDRSVFAAINTNSGDSIEFRYSMQISSGG